MHRSLFALAEENSKDNVLNKLRLASVRRESQSLDDGLYEQDDALYEQIRDIRFTVSLDHIYELIEQLPDSQRICIKLRIQGYSYQEIADLTGGHYDQVKSHIQNGKRNLSISALKVEK